MKATKKLLAIILAVCMLIGMPLSISVSAADTATEPLHIERIYIGEKGTEDEEYLFIQFSEQAILQTRADAKLITLIVYDANGTKKARMAIADKDDTALLPGASDANGLYKVRLAPSQGDGTGMADWLEQNYLNTRSAGRRIVCNIADNFTASYKNDGSIQTFKGAKTGTYLKNDNASYTLPDMGTEALVVDISDNYKVTLESLKRVNLTDFELKFSEPVTLTGGGNFGLCVMKDGAIVSTMNLTVGSWRSKTAGTTYTDTWQLGFHHANYHISLNTAIASFVASEYTDELKAAGAQVCFYIRDIANNTVNGLIDSVYTSGGIKQLKNDASIASTGTRETYFIPVNVEDLFFTPTAYVAAKDRILVEVNGQMGGDWTNNTYLSAFDANGNLLAEQKLQLVSNYKKGTADNAPTINVAFWFGQNSPINYDTFVADVESANPGVAYELKLVVKETAQIKDKNSGAYWNNLGNGVVDTLIRYDAATSKTVAAFAADQSVAGTSDIAYIPFGEIATVESVDVYDSGKVIITFSHDIDIDALLATVNQKQNGDAFYLGVSAVGVDNLVGYDTTQGTIVAGGWCDQSGLFDLERYGNSNNQVIGRIDAADYANMMQNFEELKDAAVYPNQNNLELAIRFRIEMATGYTANTGNFPLYYTIDPTEDGVKSPYITDASYRLWADVNFVEAGENVISVDGESFGTIEEGIAAAEEGSELILLGDAEINSTTGSTMIPYGVSLDLNGYTLTMGESQSLTVFGELWDNTDGNALIKMQPSNGDTSNYLFVHTDNPRQMLMYDPGDAGYRLFTHEYASQGVKGGTQENPADTDTVRYGVTLQFTNKAAYALLAEYGTECGISITMNVNTTAKLFGENGKDPAFTSGLLKQYGQKCLEALNDEDPNTTATSKTLVLRVYGMNKFREDHPEDALVVNAILTSDTCANNSVVVK